MHKLIKLSIVLISFFVLLINLQASDKDTKEKRIKKRVAVFVFEDKTDKTWHWWDRKGVGEGVSDMLITELVKTGNYRVMERTEIDEIMKEQQLGASGFVTQESAAEVGKLLGVELAVLGAVTEFGYEQSSKGGSVKGFGLGISSQSATVALDCRMVNTTTGEIVAAENIRKEKSAKGIKVDTRTIDFNSEKSFDESLVGKAARDAVVGVIAEINKSMVKVPWQAKIVTEKSGQVFINAGSLGGVQDGDRFFVYKKGESLVDPDTGLELGSIDTKTGEIEVVNASVGQGLAAQCKIISGSGFAKGDFVRLE